MVQHTIPAWQETNGTILHLGAGECTELPLYLATRAEKIVLLEPNPELAHALRQCVSHEPRVSVIEAAVAEKTGECVLYCYNAKFLATINPIDEPPLRWPGLREEKQIKVKALSLHELLSQLNLAEDKKHWMLIECPGEEKNLLQALVKAEQAIHYISLATSTLTPKIEDAWPRLRVQLHEAGYGLEDITGQGDDRFYHTFRTAGWSASLKLRESLSSLEAERDATLKLLEAEKAEKESKDKEKSELLRQQSILQLEMQKLTLANEDMEKQLKLLGEELRKSEVQFNAISKLLQ
ncbi:hypothetical protein HBJ58_19970 [Halomonas desiderata]|uniref:hypothetical protein n=1 Tax=Billgrantia desiderata TaxID=52021 RepID=UPI00174D5F8E|nr:hypothetical protein [Halomonas desiderata]